MDGAGGACCSSGAESVIERRRALLSIGFLLHTDGLMSWGLEDQWEIGEGYT